MARVKHGIVMKRRESTPEPGVRSELRSACKADDVQRVAELLNGNSVTVADASECLEETTQNLPLMRLLLEHGADPEIMNDAGQAPLHGAAFKGDLQVATLLLDHGARVDAAGPNGKTALMFAAMFNRVDIA